MIQIALAEDHKQTREILTTIINRTNFCTVSIKAENGYSLIKYLNITKTLPDIALIDVQMPIIDGLAATNIIKFHYPNIKIIAISTHINLNIVQDMFDAGADGYIVKENTGDILLHAIKEIYAGQFYIDDMIVNKEAINVPKCKPSLSDSLCALKYSEKEFLFLQLSSTALSFDQIADLMNIGKDSIYNYQKSLKEKLGIRTRQEFMLYALQQGIGRVARIHSLLPNYNVPK
jgi:DNA-binding NarL/FixJ family response regulator